MAKGPCGRIAVILRVGHRANSAARLHEIRQAGGVGAEIDVRRSGRDGGLVASHDSTADGVPLVGLLSECGVLGLTPLLDIKESGLVLDIMAAVERAGIGPKYRTFSCTTAEVPFYRKQHNYLGHHSVHGTTRSDVGEIWDPFGPLSEEMVRTLAWAANHPALRIGEKWLLDQTLHGLPPADEELYDLLEKAPGAFYLVTKGL